ncbi:MAG: uroporphyrinogen-III synthase [Bacteroidota bacterium]
MIQIFIQNDQYQKRNDLSLQKASRIASDEPFILAQLRLLRGDCNWQEMKIQDAMKAIEKGDLDGTVLSKGQEIPPSKVSLKVLDVSPSLVLSQEPNQELRFLHSEYEQEEIDQILNIELELKTAFQAKYPEAQIAVNAEMGRENEGHKRNQVQLVFLDKEMISPYLLKFSSGDASKLAERAIQKIENVQSKTIFITREIKANDGLKKGLELNGFSLKGKALIEHKVIPIKKLPESEWIFFSNRRAVQFFFRQSPDIGKRKIGCISKQVADELRKSGYRADFIGGSDSRMVGKQFNNMTGRAKVLFPKGKQDMRSVQHTNKRENTIDLIVYETVKHADFKIPQSDILVFTSPANVMTFLERNSIGQEKVIAYGDATMKTLKTKGITGIYPVHSFDNIGLARSIYGASVG